MNEVLIKAKEEAIKQIETENFKELVSKEKTKLKWPWYKKLFPYKIKITITDLRKE